MSDTLYETNQVPDHPRWCEVDHERGYFDPDKYMYAEHTSSHVSFRAESDDKELSVGTVRVDTGGVHEEKLTVEVGQTDVHLIVRDTGALCDCRAQRVIEVRLSGADIEHLTNLLTAYRATAWSRELLDRKDQP